MSAPQSFDIPESQALNARLGEVEFALGRARLDSLPRNLGIVIGNGCNIDCPHCYQLKNGDNLLRDAEIGATFRREFATLYPALSTVRIQGGEVFALRGFSELVDDIAACAQRPLISISTNGTLISEEWARRMVALPFQHVTVSLDAATPETYGRLRRGGDFDTVIGNIRRLQALKAEAGSALPTIDSFYVLMRANIGEIPQFLALLRDLGIMRASFQTMLIDARNLAREPWLAEEELTTAQDANRLHAILSQEVPRARAAGMHLVWSGVRTLFERFGLDAAFLHEEEDGLTPGRAAREAASETPGIAWNTPEMPALPPAVQVLCDNPPTCTNPWYTMFVAENGDVSLCFLSEPVGNLYETPLIEIWNSPAAIAKRSRILAGRYTESGCSRLWCDWRDGTKAETPAPEDFRALLALFRALHGRLLPVPPRTPAPEVDAKLRAVRRMLVEKDRRIAELEANLVQMWQDNANLHAAGQARIDTLEDQLAKLQPHPADWG